MGAVSHPKPTSRATSDQTTSPHTLNMTTMTTTIKIDTPTRDSLQHISTVTDGLEIPGVANSVHNAKCLKLRKEFVIGKEVQGTIAVVNKKFFLRWSDKKNDDVYCHWRLLKTCLGDDEENWVGKQVKCTITGLGPDMVSAYKMHPTTKALEIVTPVSPKPVSPRFGRFAFGKRIERSFSPSPKRTFTARRVNRARAEANLCWRRK